MSGHGAPRFSVLVAHAAPEAEHVSRVEVWLPDVDATGVLVALHQVGIVGLPTAEFARLLSGEEVEWGEFSLSVRNALEDPHPHA